MILRRPVQRRDGILRCYAANHYAPRSPPIAPDNFSMKFDYFKLKCKKFCVSVLTLRGIGVTCMPTDNTAKLKKQSTTRRRFQ
jgi:hypothetical protein